MIYYSSTGREKGDCLNEKKAGSTNGRERAMQANVDLKFKLGKRTEMFTF